MGGRLGTKKSGQVCEDVSPSPHRRWCGSLRQRSLASPVDAGARRALRIYFGSKRQRTLLGRTARGGILRRACATRGCINRRRREIPSGKVGTFGRFARNDGRVFVFSQALKPLIRERLLR